MFVCLFAFYYYDPLLQSNFLEDMLNLTVAQCTYNKTLLRRPLGQMYLILPLFQCQFVASNDLVLQVKDAFHNWYICTLLGK